MSLRVRLVSEQVLEAGESLAVQDMYLCEQVGQSKCSSRHSLMVSSRKLWKTIM